MTGVQTCALPIYKFAKKFGLSAATVRDWEQGRRYPDSTARILLKVIALRPEAVVAALKA